MKLFAIAVIILVIFYAVYFVWMMWQIKNAPSGHEDETGFHRD